jgi:Tfp pilus assembly protein PilF
LAACFCAFFCSAAYARQKSPAPADSARSQATAGPSEAADKTAAEQDIDVGSFYMHKGDYAAALSRFEDAVRLDPRDAKARLLLAESYEKEGDRSAALKCYQDYLHEFPHARDEKKIRKKIAELSRAGD